MKKNILLLPLLLSFALLQGCAGGLILVAGTAVAVTSDERSLSTQLADDDLSAKAFAKIRALQFENQDMRISVITNNGYLLVIGQVVKEQQKDEIEVALKTIEGVKEVYNQLRINKPIGFTQQTKDTWITTKAKSQLTADENINPLKIKVVTEDAELFLIGQVDKETADAATNVTRKLSGVKRVNRVFQIKPE